MECMQCGDTMVRETVINLKRRFIGFREGRSQRGYCMRCRIAVPCDSQQVLKAIRSAKTVRPSKRIRGILPAWVGAELARASRAARHETPLGGPLFLAR
jgi:hypothetical protein